MSLLMAMAVAIIPASAATENGGTVVFLTPGSNWSQSSARFAVYTWGGSSGETWIDMTYDTTHSAYKAEIPDGYSNIIFCRMNPSTTANNWNNKWNQTSDLTVPTNGTNHYTVKAGTWDNGGGTWSTSNHVVTYACAGGKCSCGEIVEGNGSHEYVDGVCDCGAEEACLHTETIYHNTASCTTSGYEFYTCKECSQEIENSRVPVSASGHDNNYTKYGKCLKCGEGNAAVIAGTGAHLGNEWSADSIANTMLYDESGTYTKVYENVAAGTYKFKIVYGGTWTGFTAIKNNNSNVTLADDGTNDHNIQFTLATAGKLTFTFTSDNNLTVIFACNEHTMSDATCTEASTCSVCGHVEGTSLGHTNGAEATCTTAQTCTVCGDTIQAALGHSFGEITPAQDATCSVDGNKAYKQCGTCSLYFADDAENNSTEGVETTESFVTTAEHTYMYECDAYCCVCYELTNEDASHNVQYHAPTTETCEENGNVAYWACEYCNACWTDEALTQISNIASVTIPATGHVDTTTEHKDATCTEDGYTKVVCSCGEVVSEETHTAPGHTAGEFYEVAPAGCTTTGSKAADCTVCGAVAETATIDALGHSLVDGKCGRCGLNSSILYLEPNSNWKVDNARFAAYFFGNGEAWVDMTDADGDGVYDVVAPAGYPSVIFCRMNPSNSANNWDNKWNQTADLTVPTNGNNIYKVKAGTWDNGGGTWSVKVSYAANSNGTNYETLEQAIADVEAGSEIVLNSDVTVEGDLSIENQVTINLNGKTLTAGAVVTFFEGTQFIGEGKLVVAKNSLYNIEGETKYVPVWNEAGYYTFSEVKDQIKESTVEDTEVVVFRPAFENAEIKNELADGAADNGISFVINITWGTGDNAVSKQYTLSEELIAEIYSQKKAIQLGFENWQADVEYTVTLRIVSGGLYYETKLCTMLNGDVAPNVPSSVTE